MRRGNSPAGNQAVSLAQQANPETPVGAVVGEARFGSDVVADTLRALDIDFIALNPGASFRGLHDSLVNHIGNERPTMLLCLHEEHAVAIAHGYAKASGRLMAAAVHSNVGLMHASMAVFNAWCDRMPLLLLGATGPVDAARRRPWIDWIHTSRDQGALIRHYSKWDDQPASPAAAREALLRGKWIAETVPQGPVYINLDAGMQEEPLAAPLPEFSAGRYVPDTRAGACRSDVKRLAGILGGALRPVILLGRASRDADCWNRRIALAKRINARVIGDLKVGTSFPTDSPYSGGTPGMAPDAHAKKLLREADVIVSLDCVDLAGTLAASDGATEATIVQISPDHRVHNGWSMDYQALPAVDVFVAADPDVVLPDLLEELGPGPERAPDIWGDPNPFSDEDLAQHQFGAKTYVRDLAFGLRKAVGDRDVSLLHVTISWEGRWWPFRHPLDYIGSDGGAGIGAGPGIAVGAALALRDSGRLPVAICGDGDYAMGVTAIWTAVRYRIPLLVVIANNRSFYNDEVHQERVARIRDRPVENRWIGQKMIDPEIDLAAMACAQGAVAFGPVTNGTDLPEIYRQAIAVVENGGVAVVDVHVEPGYPEEVANAFGQMERGAMATVSEGDSR